jgi:hypothetical protein
MEGQQGLVFTCGRTSRRSGVSIGSTGSIFNGPTSSKATSGPESSRGCPEAELPLSQPPGLTTEVRGKLASSGTWRVQAGPDGRRAGKRKTQHHLRIVRAMIEKQFNHSGGVTPSEIERRQIHLLKPPLRNHRDQQALMQLPPTQDGRDLGDSHTRYRCPDDTCVVIDSQPWVQRYPLGDLAVR